MLLDRAIAAISPNPVFATVKAVPTPTTSLKISPYPLGQGDRGVDRIAPATSAMTAAENAAYPRPTATLLPRGSSSRGTRGQPGLL